MDGSDHLAEEMAGHTFSQAPAGPHVGVEVAATGREYQVDPLLAHHHLLHITYIDILPSVFSFLQFAIPGEGGGGGRYKNWGSC